MLWVIKTLLLANASNLDKIEFFVVRQSGNKSGFYNNDPYCASLKCVSATVLLKLVRPIASSVYYRCSNYLDNSLNKVTDKGMISYPI